MEFENIVQKLLTWDEYGSIPKIHMYSMLAKEYGLSEEQREALCQDWGETFGDYTVVFPQARTVVEQLKKKYKVGIVTNGSSKMQRRKLELCGLADLFEVIVISGEFQAHKPDVEIFLEGRASVTAAAAGNCICRRYVFYGYHRCVSCRNAADLDFFQPWPAMSGGSAEDLSD